MLVAMQASRAVLVKLADRLHAMRSLDALAPAARRRMAQETLDIWAPLANRVGLWNMKAPLEVGFVGGRAARSRLPPLPLLPLLLAALI